MNSQTEDTKCFGDLSKPTNTEDVSQLTRDMRERLGLKVAELGDAFRKIKEHRSDIAKLHGEFVKMAKEPKSERICGCRTWTQFCNRKLHRDIRTIQILLKDDSE